MTRLEDLPAVLLPREAAAALRVHPRYLTRLIRNGKLRASNVGSARMPTYRVKRDDVIAFINGDTEQGRGAGQIRPSGTTTVSLGTAAA